MKLKKNLLAFFVIGIAGTLSHFVYDLSGKNRILGLFFSVNESTWEHLKLLFFPAVIYFIIEYILLHDKPDNYLPAAVTGIFYGMAAIVAVFYTVSGIIGKNIDFINIAIYFIGLIITLVKRNKIIGSQKEYSDKAKLLLYALTAITAFLFAVWSYNPPSLGIFVSPV